MIMSRRMHLFRRIIKGLGIGLGTSGIGISWYFFRKNDYDVSSIGAMRIGRAAFTVGCIFADYKWVMYGANRNSEEYAQEIKKAHTRSAERLLKLSCANGGVWIKVGQHLGAMDYILPSEYTKTMRILHSRAPESSYEDVCRVIREDLHVEASEIFSNFDKKPIGAASLAQVHKATLEDGRVVAVKVQHPKVKSHSLVDIQTMELLVGIAAYLFPEFQLMWLVETTKRNLPRELDFLHEGKNQDAVRRMYHHFSWLKIPKVHWDFCSDRVLVMEYYEGGQVDNLSYYKANGIPTHDVCRKLGQLYSEMIFEKGYVHCDPHPGNILVRKHLTKGTQLVLLDHGLYETLHEDFRMQYSNFWLSLLSADLDGIKYWSKEMNVGDLYGLFACMVTKRSWKSVAGGNISKTEATEGERDEIASYVGALLPQISDVLDRIPRPMILVLKTNDLLRSIEYTLGTQANAYSFTQMSKFCVVAVRNQAYRECDNSICRLKVTLRAWIALTKIYLYETFTAIVGLLGLGIL